MKKRKKPILPRGMLKPLFVLTLLGMSAGAKAIDSPFAFIPLHLQTTNTSTTAGGVKPNILIQFDDSGSMLYSPKMDAYPDKQYWRNPRTGVVTPYAEGRDADAINNSLRNQGWELNPAPGGQNRLEIARTSLRNILNDPVEKYTEKANFGIISLWDHGGGKKAYAQDVVAGTREFPMTTNELIRTVNNLGASGGTPALERYMDAAKILDSAMKYRCQKSYIILFSDGDANGDSHQPTINMRDGTFTWTRTQNVVLDILNPFGTISTWVAYNNPITYKLPEDMSPYAKLPPQTSSSRFPAMFTYNSSTKQYQWNLSNPSTLYGSRLTGWSPHPDAMPFVAHMLLNDLKTDKDGVDLAGKSWDDPTEVGTSQPNKIQNIKTYAIGFGEGLSQVGRHSLDNMSTANNNTALNASSEAELNAAFRKIFSDINEENVVSPPVSTASISPTAILDSSSTNHLLTATASVFLDLASGSSEVRFYKLTQSGKSSIYTLDSTGYTTPQYGQRKVLFNRGGADDRVFWLDDVAFPGSNEMFGIENTGKNATEWRDSLIPWLMRSKDDEDIAANNGATSIQYRVRSTSPRDTRNIGDVLGTSLGAFGKPQFSRPRFLSTAANDGMFYLFESQNNPDHPYKLTMNYMPAGMQRESATDTVMKYYKNIAAQNYIVSASNPHLFLLNGDIETRATSKDIPERIFMSANMGQAGRGSYSLNLAGQSVNGTKVGIDGSNWLSSVPLFETPKTAGNEMGYTIGRPALSRMSLNRTVKFTGAGTAAKAQMTTDIHNLYYATFVNSGISNPVAKENTESALYVYSTLGDENVGAPGGTKARIPHQKGQLLKKLVANPTGGGLAQVSLLDVDLDGVADMAYAGDYKGHMYRFDFRNSDPNAWTVNRIFTTKDNRPITSAPAISFIDENTYVIVFGTGSDIYQADLRNTDRQTVYGIYDFVGNAVPTATSGVSELLQQNFALGQGVGSYLTRDLTTNKLDTNRHKGWYFDLTESGERVTVRPVTLLRTILLTTRIYKVDVKNTGTNSKDFCEPKSRQETTSATGWVMQFRSDTGGKLPKKGEEDSDKFPFVDLTGDLGSNQDTDRKKVFTDRPEGSLVSGVKNADGGLLALSALFGHDDSHSAGGIGASLNLNGELLGYQEIVAGSTPSGTDRYCLNSGAPSSPLLISDSNNIDKGGLDSSATKEIYYAQCTGASLRRISWREIF